MIANAAQWLVLDNLKHHWVYWENLNKPMADQARLWCEEKGYIKDGQLTPEGEAALVVSNMTGSWRNKP